ncbi:diguanylate cyclase [Sulfurimonas sp.]|nr:diguanylate cyclase [Sulfurimonas sp.]
MTDKKITFNQFIRLISVLITVSITIIFVSYLYFMHSEGLQNNVKNKSEVISDIVFESIYTTMKSGGGRSEINKLISDIESKIPNAKITLNKTLSNNSHGAVNQVFKTKKESMMVHQSHIDYAKPIFYEKSCLKCHDDSTVGDIATVFEIESPISEISISLPYLTLIISILLILIALVGFIIWHFSLNKYFFTPISKLIAQLENVSTHKDLDKSIAIHSSIHEIQQIENVFNRQNEVLFNLYKDLESSEEVLNSIINLNDDLLFYKDDQFNYLGCNEAFLTFVGKTKENMLGHNDYELFNDEMASLFREMDIKMLERNKISSNYEWVTYPDGEKKYLLTKKIPFKYAKGKIGILGISRDITELHLSQEKVKSMSYIDELTQIYNRKAYNERIKELLSTHKRYKKSFAIMMYDIDNFKHINDTYGHKAGDEVLIEMSSLVKSNIRINDFLFRVGGEEFIILFTEIKLEDAKLVAEKIRRKIEEELIKLYYGDVTISSGLCEVSDSDKEDTIFKRVDALLYNAKRTGKNKVVID